MKPAVAGVSEDTAARASAILLVLDIVAVVIFVVIGRDTHDEGSALVDVLETAAPFLVAIAVGWLVTTAWRDPVSWRTGIGVWLVTVAGGLLLRRLMFDDGTAAPFIVVATLFLGATLLGWRLATRWILTRR